MIPLSYAQARLWFFEQAEGGGGTYNLPFALRLRGPLDREAMRSALADVLERHEALRTLYQEQDGVPVQRVLPVGQAPLPWTVSRCTERQLPRRLAADATAGFRLADELPIRARLFVLGPQEHVLLLVMHHIASDGWSLGPLVRDLAAAYSARSGGRAPDWEPLPVQYGDYTLWQQELLGDAADPDSLMSRQLGYWREALAGLPEELRLPTDRPRPANRSYRGIGVAVHADAALHARLLAFARERQATVFMVVQAALAALLTRLGAGTDVPIGSVTAGRTDEALEDLVGFFTNTLVLRTDTSGDPTFRELVDRVRETDLEAFAHQDLPFERLVEELNPPRVLGRHPLVQIVLLGQQAEADGTAAEASPWQGLTAEPLKVGTDAVKFDLTMSVQENYREGEPDGLRFVLDVTLDLFDADSVTLLGERLVRLLGAALADPELPVGDLDLLTPDEHAQALARARGPQVDRSGDPLVPDQIARLARSRPRAVAVEHAGRVLDYAELDRSANRLAHLLADAGVRRGTTVGICLERGADQVVAMLAAFRAGAAYLPLDPTYPAERLGFVLADSRAAAVVTSRSLAGQLPRSGARVLLLDELAEVLTERPVTPPAVALSGMDPAYVIFTSGSTGRPKGVVVEHRQLVDLCGWLRGYAGIGPSSRCSQVANAGFDASVFEIWPALTAGAALSLAEQHVLDDADALPRWLAGSGVTHGFLPTPRLEAALDRLAAEPGDLRFLCTGGDVLRRWLPPGAAFRVANMYGPTECTVAATAFELTTESEATHELPPIGRPNENTGCLVLDDRLQPVPDNCEGELYLSGAGVARGYLHRPGLTATRFVADPYGPPGTRMYRTGDLVRRLADGSIAFVGRVDQQVKLRGLRIETGEVESVLGRHPAVRHALVAVHTGADGAQQLVGHVVPATPAQPLEWDQLATHARLFLPDYMVPTAWTLLPELPLTANRKVDRSALPEPPAAERHRSRPPRTPRERMLCGIFTELLGGPDRPGAPTEVGAEDSFFALGGHSLLATRLVSRIRAATGLRIGVRTVFEAPTPAALAARLDGEAPTTGALDVLLPLRAAGSLPPLFCVHPAAGMSWVYAGLLSRLEPERPLHGLQARGFEEPSAAPASVSEMAKDYLEQIRRVQPQGPYHLLGWSYGAGVAHEMAVQLQASGEEVALLAMLDGYPPIPEQQHPWLPDRPATLAALLATLGYPVPADPDGLTVEDYRALARTQPGPLAGLDAALLDALPVVFAGNLSLLAGFEPGRFTGDVLYLHATADKTPASPHPRLWTPHISGTLDLHPVDCTHAGMTQPGAVAQYGPILADRLRRTSA